jgi:hypothetical protein
MVAAGYPLAAYANDRWYLNQTQKFFNEIAESQINQAALHRGLVSDN